MNKHITNAEKVSVYSQGKRAFEENMQRGYNPYRGSNLSLAISWWHGWDTAEEEVKPKPTHVTIKGYR
jgi:hypothetical protein